MQLEERERLFLEIYRRRYKYIVGYCRNHVWRDVYSAEDMAQDILENIYKNLHEFRGESSIDTWVYAVTRNYCLNRFRWTDVKKRSGKTVELKEASGVKDERYDALSEAAYNQMIEKFLFYSSQLDKKHRDVLIAIVEYGSCKDAAAAVGMNAVLFRSRLVRARKKLALKMKRRSLL